MGELGIFYIKLLNSNDSIFLELPLDIFKDTRYLIVDTSFGKELGVIEKRMTCNACLSVSNFSYQKADQSDLDFYEKGVGLLQTIKEKAIENVISLDLNMNIVKLFINLQQTKVILLYTADQRVDFRQFLSLLTSQFRFKFDLRHIGPRDRSKIVGGIANCGNVVCCNRFLNTFENISINMAKNQGLALNTQKISGPCGKLLCCLNYEDDYYSQDKKLYPKIGSIVSHENNKYKVTGFNIISKTISLSSLDNSEFIRITLDKFKKEE